MSCHEKHKIIFAIRFCHFCHFCHQLGPIYYSTYCVVVTGGPWYWNLPPPQPGLDCSVWSDPAQAVPPILGLLHHALVLLVVLPTTTQTCQPSQVQLMVSQPPPGGDVTLGWSRHSFHPVYCHSWGRRQQYFYPPSTVGWKVSINQQ